MYKCKCWLLAISVLVLVLSGCGVLVIEEPDKNVSEEYLDTENTSRKETLLSEEELLFFNETLFNQGAKSLYNYFLSSTYSDCSRINLFAVFSSMQHLALSVSDLERQFILDMDPLLYDIDGKVVKIAASDMNDVLMQCLGKSLDEMDGNGLELFVSFSIHDTYYQVIDTSYAYAVPTVEFIAGERLGNLVRLYYNPEEVYLSGSDATPLACVTLKEIEDRYIITSNQFVPIPEYLDRKPEIVIPLNTLQPWSTTKLRTINHLNDKVYCFAKIDFEEFTVGAYKSTDGNNYLAIMNDEFPWDVDVFRTLPDNAFGFGFSIEGYDGLLGEQGFKVTYVENDVSIYEYYYLTQDGISLLARGDSKSMVVDMDINYENEIVVYTGGKPNIFICADGVLYYVDVKALITEKWDGADEITFGMTDKIGHNIPLYIPAKSTHVSDYEESYYLYCFKDSIMIYK